MVANVVLPMLAHAWDTGAVQANQGTVNVYIDTEGEKIKQV